MQSSSGKQPFDVDHLQQSIRGTYLSITGLLNSNTGLNPITAFKLYRSCVLPRSLFGCELWNDISVASCKKIETAHHFCLKRAQGLQFNTRSDMVLGLLGATSLQAYIDMQKLLFFGTLCRAPTYFLCNSLFLLRLQQYEWSETQKLGFIPDITKVIRKYDLTQYLRLFKSDGVFPSKTVWKNVCYRSVMAHEETAWLDRMNSSDDFTIFKRCHIQLRVTNVWKVARFYPEYAPTMRFLASICCRKPLNQTELCLRCQRPLQWELEHLLFECQNSDRGGFFSDMLYKLNDISYRFGNMFVQLPNAEIMSYMLGKVDNELCTMLSMAKYPLFLIACAESLQRLYS